MLNAGFAATEKPTFLKFKAQKQSPHNALLICAAVVVDFCATMSASECTKRNVDRCVKWSNLLCFDGLFNAAGLKTRY
jgi:hypothetical protein